MKEVSKFKIIKVKSWKINGSPYNPRNRIYFKPGMCGLKYKSENAHDIEIGYHFNGSSDDAFGGADEWCHVKLNVSFQKNEEEKANLFAKHLMLFVNEWFEKAELNKEKI